MILRAMEVLVASKLQDKLSYTWALRVRAMIAEGAKRYDEAEADLLKALQIDTGLFGEQSPNLVGALNDLGALYIVEGRYDDAEERLKQAETLLETNTLTMDPWHAAVLLNLARLYRTENKVEEADTATRRATEIMRDTEWGRRTPERWI